MKIIDCGISGAFQSSSESWDDIGLEKAWLEIVNALAPASKPRPIQTSALRDHRILESRRNLIVSAPTNGGKSLVGDLFLLDSIRRGGRAVLLEPLRSLAQEKVDYFNQVQKQVSKILEVPIDLQISTGDYRLHGELMTAPPPENGQLIIATPERLDAISRAPEYQEWIKSIRAVCVDEAHLISNRRRGPCIERLLTNFTLQDVPPRICLLSASIGDTAAAKRWLSPCDVSIVELRHPPLTKEVAIIEEDDSSNEIVIELVQKFLEGSGNSVVVFVYQTASANKLALMLSEIGFPSVAYHSKMSAQQKNANCASFVSGRSRCVITTTALAMGVNLPATHVIIRDTSFADIGALPIQDILQMMGRAGRGQTPGHAIALKKKSDSIDDFVEKLRLEPRPELKSSFSVRDSTFCENHALQVAIRLLPESDGMSIPQLQAFFENSLGGKDIVPQIDQSLEWLTECSRLLAYSDEGSFRLTSLGKSAIKSTMPLGMVSAIGQLIRDLLEIDESDRTLRSLAPLDLLTLIELVNERAITLRRFQGSSFENMTEQVDHWVEQCNYEKPVIYRNWIRGKAGFSKADELLGSLGRVEEGSSDSRKVAYRAFFRSVILLERSNGVSINDLNKRWGISNLEGVEEQWRDTMLWLLVALTEILDVKCFYYCLRETCQANDDRIMKVEKVFKRLRGICYQLQEQIRFCSPLGGLLRSIKRTSKNGKAGIGIASIRKLEAAGITSLSQLSVATSSMLKELGLSKRIVSEIQGYIRRRRA